jgi:uncharacterized membrane protein
MSNKSWRSREPSRLEGFSDAVFGFALTLLVVSMEVPRTFAELEAVVRGFLPFAFTFATIAWIWYEHYAFFRLFDPSDRITIVLNCALLFLVLFYVYPLKFLFTLVITQFMGEPAFDRAMGREGDGVRLMVIYGIGFIVVFSTLALMFLNVWVRRKTMQLTPLETFEAWAGVIYHVGSVAVGVLSISIVLIGGDDVSMYSGMSYSLLGVAHGLIGWRYGTRREQLQAEANLTV